MEVFRIETASEDNGGLDYILESANLEGWNPGRGDLHKLFYPTDPNGFFVGILQKDVKEKGSQEEIIGCVSGVAFNEVYGFIGYYIVDPKYRGKWIDHLLNCCI